MPSGCNNDIKGSFRSRISDIHYEFTKTSHCYNQMAIRFSSYQSVTYPLLHCGKSRPKYAEVQLFTMGQTVLLHGTLVHNHFESSILPISCLIKYALRPCCSLYMSLATIFVLFTLHGFSYKTSSC